MVYRANQERFSHLENAGKGPSGYLSLLLFAGPSDKESMARPPARLRRPTVSLRSMAPRAVLCGLAVTLCTSTAMAQQRNVDPRIVFEGKRPLSYADLRMSHCGRGPLDRAFEPVSRWLIDVEDNGGPAVIAYYTQMYQVGSQGGPNNWTINHELDAYAQWVLADSARCGSSKVYVYFYHLKDDFTGTDTVEFADAIGSAWLTNYGDADGVFDSLDVLVWEQSWNEGAVEMLVGQMDPGVFFDLNLYAGDDTGYFYAEPLATDPVRAFPLAGLGLMASAEPTEWLEVFGAITDADANGQYPDFDSLSDGSWFYVGEMVLKPRFGPTNGNYRLTYYWIDPTVDHPRGRGLSISCDQPIGTRYGVFFRFAQADGRHRDLRKFVNTGIVFRTPCGWKDDRVGLGFIWGQPTDRSENDQYGMELFWRLQITARMEFSPDVQIIFDPSQTQARQAAVVGGVRMRWIF